MPTPIETAVSYFARQVSAPLWTSGIGRLVAQRAMRRAAQTLTGMGTLTGLLSTLRGYGVPYVVSQVTRDWRLFTQVPGMRLRVLRAPPDLPLHRQGFAETGFRYPDAFQYVVTARHRAVDAKEFVPFRYSLYTDEHLSPDEAIEQVMEQIRLSADPGYRGDYRDWALGAAYHNEAQPWE